MIYVRYDKTSKIKALNKGIRMAQKEGWYWELLYPELAINFVRFLRPPKGKK